MSGRLSPRPTVGTIRVGGVIGVCPTCLRRWTADYPECPIDGGLLQRIPLYETIPLEKPIGMRTSVRTLWSRGFDTTFPRICEVCGVSTYAITTEEDGTRCCPSCYVNRNP